MKSKNQANRTARFFGGCLFFAMLVLAPMQLWAQSRTITGVVTSSADGIPMPGVSVVLKGTTNGTSTDFDGNYSINVPNTGGTLSFSYIGYAPVDMAITSGNTLNVTMDESAEELEGVVVTALGLKREEKSLGYAVENVGGEELTRVVQENVLNSMSGKVSGVTINSTGGAASTVSMVIRGATSLSTDNQPLFIIDGVPVESTVNNVGGFGSRNPVDYGNAISDLDPESIEDVSILKGGSAAALYGSRAGNGVVLITTKRAKDKQKMKVSFTTNTVADVPFRFLETNTKLSTGYFSYRPEDVGSNILPEVNPAFYAGAGPENDKGYWAVQWHSPLDANGNRIPIELVSYEDNVKNFVKTALTTTNSIEISNSSDILNFRMGYTNMKHTGMVPNSDLNRNSYTLSASSKLNDKLTVSTNVNFGHTWADNRPASNRGTNPLQWAYANPSNIDIRMLEDYWVPGAEGSQVVRVSEEHDNPYFLANEVNNSFNRFRIFGNIVADWQFTDNFGIRGRYTLNKSDQTQETKIAPGYSREANNGAYGIAKSDFLERNIDILATYKRDFENFDFSVSGGANTMYQRGTSLRNGSKGRSGLIVPNVFTVGNIAPDALDYSSSLREKSINSVYGLASLGFKDMLYLDLSHRIDWSSTLPEDDNQYDYSSASLSFLLSEVVDIPKVSLFKLRGGWAETGNDTAPYNLQQVYQSSGQWGDASGLFVPSNLLSPSLQNEQLTSSEVGLDLNMFNNRVRFQGTYYMIKNENQILTIPLAASSGFDRVNLNAATLEGDGIELNLGFTPIENENWTWDLNFNYTANETKITELAEGVDFLEFWSANKSKARGFVENSETGEDGLLGNIYSRKIKRVTDPNSEYFGFPIITSGEDPEWEAESEYVKVGNYNPDFILGLQTSLRYKNFSVNMTFDWRSGGQYMSQTHRYMTEDITSATVFDRLANPGGRQLGPEMRQWVLDNRDQLLLSENFINVGGPTPEYGGLPESFSGTEVHDGVFSPGVIGYHDDNGNFVLVQENLGGEGTLVRPFVTSNPWDFGTNHMFDADYIKLREITFNYNFPFKWVEQAGLDALSVSIYSRNIMLWTKDSSFGVDPERAFQAESSGRFLQGIERYNVEPWVFPIGFKLNLAF
ncbi:SusC/RagA family TonB-linked outer membrane protein [Sediminicola luteus]|uniref:SusC/RagA family TonB-linked outer membrane protein n=1 Tax=Sediminicola luteus TaxID=319238 RepID=UPI001C0EC472|nr:SusC/RagA family TonB-linked outer membrane protein [Sediminicola luteus]